LNREVNNQLARMPNESGNSLDPPSNAKVWWRALNSLLHEAIRKLREPEAISLPLMDDDSTNSDTLCDSEESDDETKPVTDLTKSMKKLSLTSDKSVTFDLSEDAPDTPLYDADDSMSDQSNDTEEPTSQNDEVDARLAHSRVAKENIRKCIHVQSKVNDSKSIRPRRTSKN